MAVPEMDAVHAPFEYVPAKAFPRPAGVLPLPPSVRAVESGDLTSGYLKRHLVEARLDVPEWGLLVPKWMDLHLALGRPAPADSPTQERRFLETLQAPYGCWNPLHLA